MDLTALDLRFLAHEMQAFVGGKIEKIMQKDKDVLLSLYVPGKPKMHLRILLPALLCAHEHKPDVYPQTPPGFAMFLRKYIQGARINAITQRGFDRILQFDLEHRGEARVLILELLAPGNVLLLIDGKIKGLLENQNFKDRTLRGGIAYEAPPASFDPSAADDETLRRRIVESGKNSIVTVLAMDMGLGGVYAEEVCVRAGIDKKRADLSQGEVVAVVRAIRELFAQQIMPHEDEQRIYPFAMRSRETRPYTTTSVLFALARFASSDATASTQSQGERKPKESKLEVMRKAQEQSVTKLSLAVEREQRTAERMYEEYALLQEILLTAREAREQKLDVAKALGKHKQVRGYNPATSEIEVELPDA